jgi:hypothetical protein
MSHVWFGSEPAGSAEFYRDKLGFGVDTDAMIGEDFRWLTMKIKTQPGFEIDGTESRHDARRRVGGPVRSLVDKGVLGGGVFEADDIYKTYEDLKARGKFQGPPTVQSGNRDRDEGQLRQLVQPRPGRNDNQREGIDYDGLCKKRIELHIDLK